jgi:septal ring factor EnvC (AmiA/AmiB activator)
MSLKRHIEDAKGHMVNKIIPALNPSVTGEFQVRLIGCDKQFAELELRIVDPKTGQVVHRFGRATIAVGRTMTLKGLESKINFLPNDF